MWYYSNYKVILKRSKNNCISSITYTCLTEKCVKHEHLCDQTL